MEQLLPKNQIYLDEEVKEEYPTVALGEEGNSFNFRQLKNIRPLCFHCGDRNLSYGQKYFWHRCASFKHFYCYYCFDFSLKRFTHTCIGNEPILDECKTIEHLLCGKIKFECKWEGCKKIFCGSNLKKHEMSCDKQPKRECPVQDCQWSGKLDEMGREHFKQHEDSKLILRNVVLKFESDKTYYLLILGKFVKVEYSTEELGEVYEHNVDLGVCKDTLNGVKPVGLVSVNHMLLKKIDGSGSVKSIRKNVILFVYFEDE
ncbi:unnamed protein product [Ceutorhynchus assimilis]|uniref:Uncharacterized protein n=1 Tax=Ceutorhynchus assimilis TaxID=467358 RepID=A0A9N9QL63_9CUCU|nr:unnamed protein product [Ceutorhynchus assimilis]